MILADFGFLITIILKEHNLVLIILLKFLHVFTCTAQEQCYNGHFLDDMVTGWILQLSIGFLIDRR